MAKQLRMAVSDIQNHLASNHQVTVRKNSFSLGATHSADKAVLGYKTKKKGPLKAIEDFYMAGPRLLASLSKPPVVHVLIPPKDARIDAYTAVSSFIRKQGWKHLQSRPITVYEGTGENRIASEGIAIAYRKTKSIPASVTFR